MRRISTRHALVGMVLGHSVYDNAGFPLLEPGTELTKKSLIILAKHRVGEVFIEDRRTADVVAHPAVTAESEAAATRALGRLIRESRGEKSISTELMRQLEQSTNGMVRGLASQGLAEANMVGCRSFEDYNYLLPAKVAGLSIVMARAAGFRLLELGNIGLSALLMNIGHVLVPAWIVDRTDPTIEEAHLETPRHPQIGAEVLGQYDYFDLEVIEAVLQHHERWDGSGYPDGVKGLEISRIARIIAIADTFFELVSTRPGKPPLMPHEAVEYILAYSGELFEAELVRLFSRLVPLYPAGTTIKLNSGELGIVSDSNQGHIGRPIVRICSKGGERIVRRPYDINLSHARYQDTMIVEVDPYLPPLED